MDVQAEKVERDVVRAVEPSRNRVATTVRGALVLAALLCIAYGTHDAWYRLWLEFRPHLVTPVTAVRIPPSTPCPPNTICIDNTSSWITSVSVTPQGVTVPPPAPHDPPPSPIKVGPYYYRIVWKTNSGDMGDSFFEKERIGLDPSLGFGEMRSTLLHELLHCASDIGTDRHAYDPRNEDDFIQAVEPTLLQILRDNPKLLTWLTERGPTK